MLDALRNEDLYRSLNQPRGLDLTSNDTLGLTDHPHIKERMRTTLDTEPAGSGGSRLLRGQRHVFEAFEERAAAFCGSQAALLFGSGYAANVGLLQAVLSPDDLVVSDAANHASLIDGMRLANARKVVYPHQDLTAVDRALQTPHRGRAFIVTESLFGMDGDLTPLTELAEIAEQHGALLIVDEAHATGLYGANGAGRVAALGLRGRVLATVHTGGKALGSAGAWVAGPRVLRELLINHARPFIFATAPLPVMVAALHAGLDLVVGQSHRRYEVHRKAALFRLQLERQKLSAKGDSPIVPLIVGTNEDALELQHGLQEAGFDVRAVRPPTVPQGTARLRVVVRYPIEDGDLLRLAHHIAKLWPQQTPAIAVASR